jgi:hypothetical protein
MRCKQKNLPIETKPALYDQQIAQHFFSFKPK